MADDPQVEAWLRGFSEFWRQRVRKGQSSDLGGLEWCCIEIFADWLGRNIERLRLENVAKDAPPKPKPPKVEYIRDDQDPRRVR